MKNEFIKNEGSIWFKPIFSFIIIVIWLFYLFWNTFDGMVSIWMRSETFTHGFLVLPISMWLVWRKRRIILSKVPVSNLWMVGPICILMFVWLLGELVSINSITQFAAVGTVICVVIAVFGWSVASVIIFPLLFLFFLVPFGEFLLPLLMEWTAKFTVIAVRLSGVPVYQEGLHFVIPSGSWSVVEACSGVRYLISSIMIGTLYAYLNYRSLNRRIVFVCVSILVPIVANWMRAYFIVMLGHISGNRLAVGFDHLIYGWLFFGLVVMLMFLIGGRWAENTDENDLSFVQKYPIVSTGGFNAWPVTLLVSLVLVVPVLWINFITSRTHIESPVLEFPASWSSGWQLSNDRYLALEPKFEGSYSGAERIYKKDSLNVGLYIKYYRNQNAENKLVSSQNVIFDSNSRKWIQLSADEYSVNALDGLSVKKVNWRGRNVSDDGREIPLQTWQFYWVNGVFTESDYKAKIYGAMQRFFGKGDDSAIIVIYAIDGIEKPAEASIENFLLSNISDIRSLLEKTGS